MNTPRTFICAEIAHREERQPTKPRKIHEIIIAGYTQIVALNAFMFGQRKGASPPDREYHRDRCCWGPSALFSIKTEEEWLEDTRFWLSALEKYTGKSQREQIRESFGADCEAVEDIPRIRHATMWEFFKAIGFNHKTRRYVDKLGHPIKFSVLPKQPKKRICETKAQT